VLLEISPRANRPIKEGARVWIHHGSSSVAAKVVFFSGHTLNVGESALAQLRLETPAFVFITDRFIVRDWAGQNTLAGGIVLDADAGTSFRSETRLGFLKRRADAPADIRTHVLSQLMRDGATKPTQLLLKSRFSDAEIRGAVSRLGAEGVLTVVGDYIADSARWSAICSHAVNAIDAAHRAHPEHAGIALNDLRAIVQADPPFDALFDALIEALCRAEFVQTGAWIRRAAHRPALPGDLQEAGAKLRAALARKPFDPPSRKELAPDSASQHALRFLIETGEAIEINAEVVMSTKYEKQATELICRFLRDHGPATVSALRQTIGSSRRVIIPLLERLDRAGVTERMEDKRALRQKRQA
jgi:selenocysteine-specific elongation factor